MIVVHEKSIERDARKAAIAVAEGTDLSPGTRWRLASTDGNRTRVIDMPTAAVWIAMLYVFMMRIIGREVAMVDWRTMPARIQFEDAPRNDRAVLAERTADLLWANRNALVVEGDVRHLDPAETAITIRLPGGVDLKVATKLHGASRNYAETRHLFEVVADGNSRSLEDGDALPLAMAWKAIICQAFLDAVEPGRTTLERRSDSVAAATAALCRVLERANPPREARTYRGHRSKYDYNRVDLPSTWRELPNGALFCRTENTLWDAPMILVTDGRLGSFSAAIDQVEAAEDRRATGIVEAAIAQTPPPMAGPAETGSARAAILMRLLRDALDRWPDLADAGGTPIQPLLASHLPRLLDAYLAERDLPGGDPADAQAHLDEGLDVIAAALDEALAARRERKRDDLRVEIAFLRARHPERTLGPVLDA